MHGQIDGVETDARNFGGDDDPVRAAPASGPRRVEVDTGQSVFFELYRELSRELRRINERFDPYCHSIAL